VKAVPRPLTAPWAITPEGMQLVLGVWSRGDLFAERIARARADMGDEPMGNVACYQVRDGVAIIPICGPLVRHADLFSDISGATSYEGIRRDLAAAVADSNVRAILLDVASPGGEVEGIADAAAAIRAAAIAKPLVAYAGGMCASAAYWLASAAPEIVASDSALIGSIGVRITLLDDSKAEEMIGLRTVEIVNDESPDKAAMTVDDALVARCKARANEIASVFIDSVAVGRKVSAATVIADFGKGDVMIASRARDAGMVDALGTLDGTLGSLAARVSAPVVAMPAGQLARAKENRMSTTHNPAAPAANMTDGTCTGCAKAMSGPDPIYCSGCAGKGDMKAQAAGKFTVDVLAALDAKSLDEAIGAIAALKQEAAAAVDLRARFEQHAASARAEKFRASLSGAGPKLAISDLLVTIPALLDEHNRERATKAIDVLDPKASAEAPAIIAALCGALTADGRPTLTEGEANRVGAYLARKAPQSQPAAVIEPARDPAKDAAHVEANAGGRLAAIDRGFDRAIGTDPKQTAPAA
jgi:ClpP class serine protease